MRIYDLWIQYKKNLQIHLRKISNLKTFYIKVFGFIFPSIIPPGQPPPLYIIAPRKIWSPDSCLVDDCPRLIAPRQLPRRQFPLTISPCKLPPRKIVFRMICHLHNAPPLHKLPARKIAPRKNYTQDYFPQESEWELVF